MDDTLADFTGGAKRAPIGILCDADRAGPAGTIEEIFSTVATVHSFETEAHALQLANGIPQRLTAQVAQSYYELDGRYASPGDTALVRGHHPV